MKLYTTDHCPRCTIAKKILSGMEYQEKNLTADWDEFQSDCQWHDVRDIREAPILVTDEMIYTGEDVILKLEEMRG